MRVRIWVMCAGSIALGVLINQPIQAESGHPSQQTLAAMGLGGMTVLSDDDASSIRGFGFKGGHGVKSSVAVFGNSFATINTPFGSAHSENGYAASGSKFAKGSNFSEAGVEFTISGGNKGGKKPGGKMPVGKSGVKMPWPGKGGMKAPWPGKGGHGGMGKKPGGGHGGKPTTISVRVFAGGSSFAKAK